MIPLDALTRVFLPREFLNRCAPDIPVKFYHTWNFDDLSSSFPSSSVLISVFISDEHYKLRDSEGQTHIWRNLRGMNMIPPTLHCSLFLSLNSLWLSIIIHCLRDVKILIPEETWPEKKRKSPSSSSSAFCCRLHNSFCRLIKEKVCEWISRGKYGYGIHHILETTVCKSKIHMKTTSMNFLTRNVLFQSVEHRVLHHIHTFDFQCLWFLLR